MFTCCHCTILCCVLFVAAHGRGGVLDDSGDDSGGEGGSDDESIDDIALHTDVNVPALLKTLRVRSEGGAVDGVSPGRPAMGSAFADVARALRAAGSSGAGNPLWVRLLYLLLPWFDHRVVPGAPALRACKASRVVLVLS